MAVRSGMTDLLVRVRAMVADQGTVHWTNQQLQDVLDVHRIRIHREPLTIERTLISGTDYEYTKYHSRYENYEAGGTDYFQIEDAAGSQRGTADYTVDYIRGMVTMSADQVGTQLYLSGWSYDLNAAASDVWLMMAGSMFADFGFTADGHRMDRQQQHEHCMNMHERYNALANPMSVRMHGLGDVRD